MAISSCNGKNLCNVLAEVSFVHCDRPNDAGAGEQIASNKQTNEHFHRCRTRVQFQFLYFADDEEIRNNLCVMHSTYAFKWPILSAFVNLNFRLLFDSIRSSFKWFLWIAHSKFYDTHCLDLMAPDRETLYVGWKLPFHRQLLRLLHSARCPRRHTFSLADVFVNVSVCASCMYAAPFQPLYELIANEILFAVLFAAPHFIPSKSERGWPCCVRACGRTMCTLPWPINFMDAQKTK